MQDSIKQIGRISVICPTHNSSSFVLRALKSVARQTLKPLEIIVCDDGSTDATVAAVEDWSKNLTTPLRLIKGLHKGPGAARNEGIKRAQAQWIAFLDSDDAWSKHKLEVMVQAINENPEANFFCHTAIRVHQNGAEKLLDYGLRRFNPIEPLIPQLYALNLFLTSSVICSKELLLRAGLFDENLMSSQDYELWLRMSPFMKPHFIPQPLGYYHDRSGSVSKNPSYGRWRNDMVIAWRHRNKVAPLIVASRLLRLTGQYLKAYLPRKRRQGWGQ